MIMHIEKLLDIQSKFIAKRVGVSDGVADVHSPLVLKDFEKKIFISPNKTVQEGPMFYLLSDVIWFLNYRKGGPGKAWVQDNYMK